MLLRTGALRCRLRRPAAPLLLLCFRLGLSLLLPPLPPPLLLLMGPRLLPFCHPAAYGHCTESLAVPRHTNYSCPLDGMDGRVAQVPVGGRAASPLEDCLAFRQGTPVLLYAEGSDQGDPAAGRRRADWASVGRGSESDGMRKARGRGLFRQGHQGFKGCLKDAVLRSCKDWQ